jgi:hypothetical protein
MPGTNYGTNPSIGNYSVAQVVDTNCIFGVNIIKLMCNTYNTSFLPTLFFDKLVREDGSYDFAPKSIKTATAATITGDDAVTWGEQETQLRNALITAAVSGNDVFVADPTVFEVGDKVKILYCDPTSCCEIEEFRLVTATNTGATVADNFITVDGSAITIAFPNTKEGCAPKVFRLYRPYKRCDSVNGSTVFDRIEYKKSFFQHFGDKVCYTTKELHACYPHLGGAQAFVDQKNAKSAQKLFEEFLAALWYGSNVAATATTGPETMGVISGIKDAEVRYGIKLSRDVSCATTNDQKIQALLQEVELASRCGVNHSGEIYLVGNGQAVKSLALMTQAWSRIMGCVPICESNNDSMKIGKPYKVELPMFGITLHMYADPFLTSQYPNSSIAVMIPTDFITLHTYENDLNDQFKLGARQRGIFQMKDISHLYDGQFDCQKCYKVT